MKPRDRIQEFRRVPAADLITHPKNWRSHPQAQLNALKGILDEVGWADATDQRAVILSAILHYRLQHEVGTPRWGRSAYLNPVPGSRCCTHLRDPQWARPTGESGQPS